MTFEMVLRELMETPPATGNEATLAPVTPQAQEFIRQFAQELRKYPQVDVKIQEHLHAGVYSRTGVVPAGTVACGALIKRPTQLIMHGHMRFNNGVAIREYKGYHVFEGEAARAQIGYAIEDTWFTVLFATDAETIEEARAQLTDEKNLLGDRK